MKIERQVRTSDEMESLGASLSASNIEKLDLVTLTGALGAGKTTLVRGILRGVGYKGSVKSPTFSLHESYPVRETTLHHFDLYRVENPDELEFIDFREALQPSNLVVVEWPERAEDTLPDPDLEIIIEKDESGRRVYLIDHSKTGRIFLDSLK